MIQGKKNKLLVVLLVTILLLGIVIQTKGTWAISNGYFETELSFDDRANPNQYIGEDRIQSAILVSQKVYSKSKIAVLADSYTYSDLLSALSLASQNDAPILYSNSRMIDSNTEQELDRLGVEKIFFVGGMGLKDSYKNKYQVETIYGPDRYKTNFEVNKNENSDYAILVSGENFPDAITSVSLAYKKGIPIYLTNRNKITDCIRSRLQDKTMVYVVGGQDMIPDSLLEGLNYKRFSGKDRYATNIKFNSYFYSEPERQILTSGDNYPDAIAAAPFANKYGSPIILVKRGDDRSFDYDAINVGFVSLKQKYAVFVSPHQDDESLYMGLDMFNQAQSGKDIYVMMMTDGRASAAFKSINIKLSKEGLKRISIEEFIKARNRDAKEACQQIAGKQLREIIFFGYENTTEYENLDLTRQVVLKEIEELAISRNLNPLQIYISTVADPSGSAAGSGGRGALEHQSCTLAVYQFAKNNNIDAHFWGKSLEEAAKEGVTVEKKTISKMAREALFRAKEEYDTWSPKSGRYSTGTISCEDLFYDRLEEAAFYENKILIQ